jgi:hypothetical protein
MSPPALLSSDDARAAAVKRLVSDLEHNFRDAVQRSMRFNLDGSVASLAIVDHYLEQARDEQRAPILALLAASAGAYFGELVRNHLGAQWIGDASDPRHLRLLLTPEFAYFSPPTSPSPPSSARTPIPTTRAAPPASRSTPRSTCAAPPARPRTRAERDDPDRSAARSSRGRRPHDRSLSILPTDDPSDDASWIAARLGELSPVSADEFYSLTTRYETLELILQMLASRRAQAGYEPYTYTIDDYLHAFS